MQKSICIINNNKYDYFTFLLIYFEILERLISWNGGSSKLLLYLLRRRHTRSSHSNARNRLLYRVYLKLKEIKLCWCHYCKMAARSLNVNPVELKNSRPVTFFLSFFFVSQTRNIARMKSFELESNWSVVTRVAPPIASTRSTACWSFGTGVVCRSHAWCGLVSCGLSPAGQPTTVVACPRHMAGRRLAEQSGGCVCVRARLLCTHTCTHAPWSILAYLLLFHVSKRTILFRS